MTPKEKAEELVRKYYTWGIRKEGQTLSWLESKQCALIAVNEINKYVDDSKLPYPYNEYWDNVKQEIENL